MSHEAATMSVRDDHGSFFLVVLVVSDQPPVITSYVTHHGQTVMDLDAAGQDWVVRPGVGPFSQAEMKRLEAACEALATAFEMV